MQRRQLKQVLRSPQRQQQGNMEGMQTCLHGGGEKCLPKGLETQQASLEYTLMPAKHYLQAAHAHGSYYRLLQNTTQQPLSNVHESPKQYLSRQHLWEECLCCYFSSESVFLNSFLRLFILLFFFFPLLDSLQLRDLGGNWGGSSGAWYKRKARNQGCFNFLPLFFLLLSCFYLLAVCHCSLKLNL